MLLLCQIVLLLNSIIVIVVGCSTELTGPGVTDTIFLVSLYASFSVSRSCSSSICLNYAAVFFWLCGKSGNFVASNVFSSFTISCTIFIVVLQTKWCQMVTFRSIQCHPGLTNIFNFWHSGTLALRAELTGPAVTDTIFFVSLYTSFSVSRSCSSSICLNRAADFFPSFWTFQMPSVCLLHKV